MATKTTAQEKIDALIAKLEDPFLRNTFGVCSKNGKYPKDCIVDGALEKMVKIVLDLEEAAHAGQPVQRP